MNDRYIKTMLTIIAVALLYLCIVMTPLPRLSAQTPSRTPGVSSGPMEVIVVGYNAQAPMPVVISGLVEVTASNPLRITGNVSTERSSDNADRVIVVGWEENAVRQKASTLQQLSDNDGDKGLRALPIKMVK
jgi:hypothetical protein